MLTIKPLAIPDVKLLMSKMLQDSRGYFAEIAQEKRFEENGLPRFVQENQSLSVEKGTIRGLHAQKPPHAQAKLIRVLNGTVFDVAVDVRPGSKTFGQHIHTMLQAEGDITQLFIPAGFLHGFCTLTENTVVSYKVSDFYAPGSEIGVIWNDPDLKIDWPIAPKNAVLSPKDTTLGSFKDFPRLEW